MARKMYRLVLESNATSWDQIAQVLGLSPDICHAIFCLNFWRRISLPVSSMDMRLPGSLFTRLSNMFRGHGVNSESCSGYNLLWHAKWVSSKYKRGILILDKVKLSACNPYAKGYGNEWTFAAGIWIKSLSVCLQKQDWNSKRTFEDIVLISKQKIDFLTEGDRSLYFRRRCERKQNNGKITERVYSFATSSASKRSQQWVRLVWE